MVRGGVQQLVGRERELELLERELARLERGEGGVVQLVGEPGIGKTRLVTETLERARARDYLALVGRSDEFQQSSPFGIFVDALDDHLSSFAALEERLAPSHLLQLGIIFPALSHVITGDAAQLPSDRHRAYRAVRVLLEQLSREQPLVLALDDLQWADPGSQELFSYLVRNLPLGRVLIVAAQRPWPHLPQLGSGEGSLEYVELQPLALEQARALFPRDVDRATRDALLELSGGNPFYVEQLVRSALRGRGVQEHDASVTPVPDVPQAVVNAISGELSALSERTLTVLQAAAVIGDKFEFDLVAETGGMGADRTLAALDELTEQDLIRPVDPPRVSRFRHPIVRRVVYESARLGWRLGAHARAAAALETRGAPPEGRAHHVQRSARVGDELAIALLAKAATANAWRAPATAAVWFEAALSLLPANDPKQRRLELTLQGAMALAAAGQLERARDTLADLLGHLPRELTELRGQAVGIIAMVDQVLTNHERAERLLQRTLHELPETDLTERAMLRNVLAVGKMFQGDFEGARDWALQAVESARKIDAPLTASSASIVSVAELNRGDVKRARQYAEEAATLVDTMPDSDLAVRLYGLPWLAWTEHWLDDLEQAALHFDRGVTIARTAGQTAVLVPLIVGQTNNMARQGKLAEAAEIADEAVELAHVCGSDQFLGWAHTMRCLVDVQRGELPAALSSGERGVRAQEKLAGSPMSALAGSALAEAQLESGLPDQCRDSLLEAAGGPSLPLMQRGLTARAYEVLTQAELALGDIEAAERWANRLEHDTLGLQGRVAHAGRARAAVLLARDDASGAADAALTAAAAADSAGAPVEAARARLLAGIALAQAGRRDDALAELECSQGALAEHGAARYADQAARELRRLGRRVQRKGRRTVASEGIGALTDRELELSRLVATGKTNRQIAAELFISEKTVQNHLSSIFAKLGVSSRAAVAGIVERVGP